MRTLRLVKIWITQICAHIEHWMFVHLCPGEYDYMRHLVDDLIRLNQELQILNMGRTDRLNWLGTGSNDKTRMIEEA